MSGKSLEVSIKPDVLVWARESLGISVEDVARRIKASIETINQWEFSKKNPTFKQLEKLSRIYRRPLAAFFLPSPPKEPPLPKDFRTLPPEKKKPISVKTRLAIRRARRLQELANKLAKSLKRGTKEVLDIAKTNENPEEIAVKIREELGISLKTQFEWGDEREALNNWISALEKTGILILQLGMPVKENRGFSLAEDHIKVIVINNQDAVRAKIFSLFHEYGHLLLRSSSLCDLEERFYQTSEIEKTEIFCNRFAGSFLVPKDALIQHDVLKSQKYNATGWTDNLLRELADDFKVSQEVILRRLVILGVASRDFYKKKHEAWASKEPFVPFGKQNPPKKCIRENGLPFVSLTLEAHKAGRITYSDLADYLSIQLKHVPKIEQLVRNEA